MSKGGFKELRVWQKGKELAVYIYQITNIKYALKFKIDLGTLENLSPLAICLSTLSLRIPENRHTKEQNGNQALLKKKL